MPFLVVACLLLQAASAVPEALGETPREILAEYESGVVTRAEFGAWLAYRRPAGSQKPGGELEQRELRELVLIRLLGERHLADPDAIEPGYAAWLRLLREREAASWLRAKLLEEAKPSEADLRAAFEAQGGDKKVPARWRLKNILKTVSREASAEERRAARQEIEGVRQRILDGESFELVARQESDSQTRLRGGRMGMVTLKELRPAVGEIVAKLEAGDLSPVLEGPAGFTLLQCDQKFEPKTETYAESAERLGPRLANERLESLWGQHEKSLLPRLGPTFAKGPEGEGSPPAVVRFADGTPPILPLDAQIFLRDRGRGGAGAALPPAELLRLWTERALLVARAAEAKRRGIDEDSSFQTRLAWKTLELQAALVEDLEVRNGLRMPALEELRQAYEKAKEDLVEPRRRKLRILDLQIEASRPASFYERLQALGRDLAMGKTSFDQVVEVASPHGSVEETDWLSQSQIFELGLNAEAAIAKLEPGESTGALQEGRRLRVYQLLEDKPERQLSFEEVERGLGAKLFRAARARARSDFRQSLLRERGLKVHLALPAPSTTAIEPAPGDASAAGQETQSQ